MSSSSVSSLIATLSMKPISPMLVRSIANACAEMTSAAARIEPVAETPPAPTQGGALDQRA